MANQKHKLHYRHKQRKLRACKPCGDTCPICLEIVNRNKCLLQCGHTFHTQCIDTWFLQQWDDSQNALEHELEMFGVNTRGETEAPVCAMVNKTIMCYLGQMAKFSCPVCKQQFSTKEDIDGSKPSFDASDLMPILCEIDLGELYGVQCTHYITDFDELFYYAPIDSLEYHETQVDVSAHETDKKVALAVNDKFVLIDKHIQDHIEGLVSEVKDGFTRLKLYQLGNITLLNDRMLEDISPDKQVGLLDIRNYIHPNWFNR